MPAPGTKGKIPQMRNTVMGHLRPVDCNRATKVTKAVAQNMVSAGEKAE